MTPARQDHGDEGPRLLLVCDRPERAVHMTTLLHASAELPAARGPAWSLSVVADARQAIGRAADVDAILVDLRDDGDTAETLKALDLAPVVAIVDAADAARLAHCADEIIPEAELSPLVLERTLRICDTRQTLTGRIEFLTQRDVLTGLPNRKLYERQVEHALHSARRHDRHLAIGCLSIDGFAEAAARLGQIGTEALLIAIADRLARTLRRSDLIARAHEDSFLVMMELDGATSDLAAAAEKMLSVIRAPVDLESRSIEVTASLGIALYPSAGQTVTELLREARLALSEAQSRGGGDFRFFDAELEVVTRESVLMEKALPAAIARGELAVRYQPRLDLARMRITGAEVLARWHSPTFGTVAPERFVSIAEESGAIGRLGDWVLRAALADVGRWCRAGHDIHVGVNVSAGQFADEDFTASVRNALEDAAVPPSALEFEITERVLVDNVTRHRRLFDELAGLGIGFSLDDFGIGYSSLAYLKQFPVHTLKIDRVFVSPLPNSRADAAIVRAIVALGHALEMRVVAEGVETEAQLEFLRGAGCDEAQGFLVSRACPADVFERMLDDARAGAAWNALAAGAADGHDADTVGTVTSIADTSDPDTPPPDTEPENT